MILEICETVTVEMEAETAEEILLEIAILAASLPSLLLPIASKVATEDLLLRSPLRADLTTEIRAPPMTQSMTLVTTPPSLLNAEMITTTMNVLLIWILEDCHPLHASMDPRFLTPPVDPFLPFRQDPFIITNNIT